MKNIISFIVLLSLLSCKKEKATSAQVQKDFSAVHESIDKNSSAASKQVKEELFNFTTELCHNKGHFDANTYSREELEGTFKLWFEMAGSMLSTPSVFNLNSLQKARAEKDKILAQLDKDFSEKKKVLENLHVVKDPYWKNLKNSKLQELNEEYEFRRIELQAFSDPSVLVNHTFSKSCESYAKALNSTETQKTEMWRQLREEMSRKNSDSQRIMNEFESRLHSADKNDYAIIDLITFGWGNCANDKMTRNVNDENMYEKFKALFLKIDSECDEP